MRLMIVGIVLISSTTGLATEKKHSDPRLVIEAYIAAALAGKVDEAVSLALEDNLPSNKAQVLELNEVIDAPTLKVLAVWVSVQNNQAVALTEHVKITPANPDERDTGCFVFTLARSKDIWLVMDIDFDTEEEAIKHVEEFKKDKLDLECLRRPVLAPNGDASTEAADIWLRVTGGNIQIATTPEVAKAMREGGESAGGMLVNCKSLTFNVNDEGKVFECEGCSFSTWTGIKGKAQRAVFDLAKGTVTLSGDDTSPVELMTNLTGQKVEQKLVTKSVEMTLPPDKPRLVGVPVDDSGPKFFTPDPPKDPKLKSEAFFDGNLVPAPTDKLKTQPPPKEKVIIPNA